MFGPDDEGYSRKYALNDIYGFTKKITYVRCNNSTEIIGGYLYEFKHLNEAVNAVMYILNKRGKLIQVFV